MVEGAKLMEKALGEFVERMRSAAGVNLRAVVLYGSAAAGEFHKKHSDLNTLCLVQRAGAAELEKLSATAEWWTRKGHPAPLVFTLEELQRSADIFAIELLDIKAQHRILFGDDFLGVLEVPLSLHSLQVERELRTNWVRLRQAILLTSQKKSALSGLMTASISSFVALFRHALIVLGEKPPEGRRAVIDRIAAVFQTDAGPLHEVLAVREGKRKENELDVAAILAGYLAFVEQVTDGVDRRLAGGR